MGYEQIIARFSLHTHHNKNIIKQTYYSQLLTLTQCVIECDQTMKNITVTKMIVCHLELVASFLLEEELTLLFNITINRH